MDVLELVEKKAHPAFHDEHGKPPRPRIEYDLALDEFDVAFKVGYDTYWVKPVEEREMMLAAERILSAIRTMTQFDAYEANKPKT